jgi:hypothetical protein
MMIWIITCELQKGSLRYVWIVIEILGFIV